MKNECEPYLGMTTDYDDRGIYDVELRLILPKTAWEDFEKQEFYNQLMEWFNCLRKGCKYESKEVPQKSVKIYFLCNGKVPECKYAEGCFQNGGGCKRTSHIDYARNFEKHAEDYYREKENGKTWREEIEEKCQGTFTED